MTQSGTASTRTFAKLTRISDVPETPTLPRVIELPPSGDASVVTIGIGRGRDNGAQLDCPTIPSLLSREKHAEIDYDQHTAAHYLRDNESLNGTYVNGTLIPPGWLLLNQGDVIAFGGPAHVSRTHPKNCLHPKKLFAPFLPSHTLTLSLRPLFLFVSGHEPQQVLRGDVSLRNPFRFVYSADTTRVVAPVSRLTWKAVSRSEETPTTCHHCRGVIPANFLRIKRTETLSEVETDRHFHVNYNCSRGFHQEIRNAPVVDDLPELSDQEKRVVKNLIDVIGRFGDR